MTKITRAINVLKWRRITKKFKTIGTNSRVGNDFQIFEPDKISIGDNFSANDKLKLQAFSQYKGKVTGYTPKIEIGNNVSFMDNCQISCADNVTIGDGVLFGDNVFVTDNFHGNSSFEEMQIPPSDRKLYVKGPVKIEKNVWLGRNVCVMPNVTIGEGAVVGANSVVTKDVPRFSIVGGVSARIIKEH